MAAEKIGPARCPLCGGTAAVSLSKSGLTVLTGNCCNVQVFARSGNSDERIRALLIKAGAPSPEPAIQAPPAPAPEPAPSPAPPPPAKRETDFFL